MRVSFVRTVGHPDRVYVVRSDGSEASWSFPTYGDGLPHDLVHLVAEAAFGIRRGLFGLVDSGIDMERVNQHANRSGGADKYRALGDRREIMLSEALAAALSATYLDVEGRLALLRESAGTWGIEVPEEATRERFETVLGVLQRLQQRWRGLTPKGALDFEFPSDDPKRSFDALVKTMFPPVAAC